MATQDYTIVVSSTGTDDVAAALGGIGQAGDAAVQQLNASFATAVQTAVRSGQSMSEAINDALESINAEPITINVTEVGVDEVIEQLTNMGLTAEQAQARIESGFVRTAQSAETETNAIALLNRELAAGSESAAAYAAALDVMTAGEINAAAKAEGVAGAVTAAGASMKGFGAAATSLAAIMGVFEFVKLSDDATTLGNKINQLTQNVGQQAQIWQSLMNTAQQTRISLNGVGDTFFKLSQASKDLGFSQQDMLTITDSLAKALSLSGVTGSQATNAMRDFIDMIARGEPIARAFNALQMQAPTVLQAIAKGMGMTTQEFDKWRESQVGATNANKNFADEVTSAQVQVNELTQKLSDQKNAYQSLLSASTSSSQSAIAQQRSQQAASVSLNDTQMKLQVANDKLTEAQTNYTNALNKSQGAGSGVKEMLNALLKSNVDLSEQQLKTSPTIAQGFTVIANAVEFWLHGAQNATLYNTILYNSFKVVADNVNIIIPLFALLAGAVAVVKIGNLASDMLKFGSAIATTASRFTAFAVANPILAAIILAVGALSLAFMYLVEKTGGVGPAFQAISNFFNEWKVAIVGVTTTLAILGAALALPALITFGTAVGGVVVTLGGFALAFAPIAIAAGVLGFALVALYQKFGGFTGLWEAIKTGASALFSYLTTGFSNIWTGVGTDLSSVGTLFTTAFSTLSSTITSAFTAIGTLASDIWNGLWTNLTDIVTNFGTRFHETLQQWQEFFAPFGTAIESAWTSTWAAIADIFTGFGQRFQESLQQWLTFLTPIFSAITTGWNGLWDGAKSYVNTALTAIEGYWTDFQTFMSNLWQKITQPIQTFWTQIKSLWTASITALEGYWTAFVSWINDNLITPIETAFTQMWSFLSNGLTNWISNALSGISKIASYVKGIFGGSDSSSSSSSTAPPSPNFGSTNSGTSSSPANDNVTAPSDLDDSTYRNGGSFTIPAYRDGGVLDLPGFRDGSVYSPTVGSNGMTDTVPGTGAPDTHLAQFKVSPGERVIVQTPQQQMDHDRRMDATKDMSTGEPTQYRNGGVMAFRDGVTFSAATDNSTTGYEGYTIQKSPTAVAPIADQTTSTSSSSSSSSSTSGGEGTLTAQPWAGQWASLVAGAPVGSQILQASKHNLVPYPGTAMTSDPNAKINFYTDGSSVDIKDFTGTGITAPAGTTGGLSAWPLTSGLPIAQHAGPNTITGSSGWWGEDMNDYYINTTGAGIPFTPGSVVGSGGDPGLRDGGSFDVPAFRDGGIFDLGFFAARDGMDYDVPGAGGTDSRMMGLAVTPGEKVSVQTSAQQAQAAKSTGPTIIHHSTINVKTPDADSFRRSARQIADANRKQIGRALSTATT